ncbi:nucleotidyltransferase substrate binding protein [Echinicola sp. CAU 1574]|uniref:Nucleotidyltransferase substrate binding protein n=1 Tax=Echinicola arenosa TaxID=2774144 RepID=A0ABR9AFA7_9BACT|nr:nucleotidyltransferase substrate binding protein [Echinicola arenosa]MBD8487366.1 nucleotidyltransferase substrate binding protein [Echinicola arenosa]
MSKDIRWEQRFANYNKALLKLEQAVEYIRENYYHEGEYDEQLFEKGEDIVKEGLIQRFEYTHELAWNVMKDFLKERGNIEIYGSRDATREAFSTGLIREGKIWMEMIQSRNKTSHTYNEDTAQEIFSKILEEYFPELLAFRVIMKEKRRGDQKDIFEG